MTSGADFIRFLLLRIYIHKQAIVTKNAMTSENGALAHTPLMPYMPGRMSKAGIRNMSCRESDKNIDTLALPIDWKKLEITICPPMRQKAVHVMRKPLDARSIRVASVVKSRTMGTGMSCDKIKPNEVTIVPAMIP